MSRTTENPENAVATTTHEFFAPATIKPLFWRPRFRVSSPVQSHAPLLFWLAADAHVRRAGVLGAGDGFSHFLLCQAIDKLNSGGRCTGLGFWTDRKSGEECSQPPTALREHAEQFYEGISDLRAVANLGEAIEIFGENELDFLFVDLSALPEADPPHVEDLVERLGSNAILVFHGTNALRHCCDYRSSFGKQLDRLDCLEFREGAGVRVFPIGEDQPLRLKKLMTAREHGEVPGDIDVVFRRLGQSIAAMEEVRALEIKVSCLTKALAEAQARDKEAQQELPDLREAYKLRSKKLSETQSLIFDLQNQLVSVVDEKAELQKSLRKVEAAAAEAAREIEAAHAKLAAREEELEGSHKELKTEKAARFEETAALTRMLEEDRAKSEAERAELEARNRALQKHHDELLSSTSWKVTAPMRKLKQTLGNVGSV